MGYTRHHAILVTTYKPEYAQEAHAKAMELIVPSLGNIVTPLMGEAVNGLWSFAILPDGSQEGWDLSDVGDFRRKMFIDWMDSKRFADGSGPYTWAEVQYGDDDGENEVTAHDDEEFRRAAATTGG